MEGEFAILNLICLKSGFISNRLILIGKIVDGHIKFKGICDIAKCQATFSIFCRHIEIT